MTRPSGAQRKKVRAAPYHSDRARWNKVRAQVLAGEPWCRLCFAAGRVRAAQEVDHIRAIADGGPAWDLMNLQPLCAQCHGIKTRREREQRQVIPCVHGYSGEYVCRICSSPKEYTPRRVGYGHYANNNRFGDQDE